MRSTNFIIIKKHKIVSKEIELKELNEKLETALDAIDTLNDKVKEYDTKFEALANNVTSLAVADKPAAKRVIADPGVVTIGREKYKFGSLAFRVSTAAGLVKYIAEDVAKDAALCAELLEKHPSVFVKA